MANDTNKLKLAHLLWMLLSFAVLGGVAYGVIKNQQEVNTKAIEKKVDKELFQMYIENNEKQLGKMDGKLDRLLEK